MRKLKDIFLNKFIYETKMSDAKFDTRMLCRLRPTFKYDCYSYDLYWLWDSFSDWWSRNSHKHFSSFVFLFYCTKWYSPQLECVIFDAFSPALCGRAIARSSLWRNIRCFVAFLVEEVANYLLLWLRVSFHYVQKMKNTFIKLSSLLKCIRCPIWYLDVIK